MQTISYYIYEHDTISPELQKSIKNGKNIFTVIYHKMIDTELRGTSPPNVVDRLKQIKILFSKTR